MRVAFLDHLLWDRYGTFWVALAEEAGAEVLHPAPRQLLPWMDDARTGLATTPSFRLAVASGLAAAEMEADLWVVPRLNPPSEGGPGGAQDPWIADLPAALSRLVPGLPPVWSVPAELIPGLDGEAVAFLRRLGLDAGLVSRAWSKLRGSAKPQRPRPLRVGKPGDGPGQVAYLAQPWCLTPALLRLAVDPEERVVTAARFDPAELRAEADRHTPGLLPTDAEVLGAVRRLARSASVAKLRMLVDHVDGSDAWLLRRAQALAPGKVEAVVLQDLAEPEALALALLGADPEP